MCRGTWSAGRGAGGGDNPEQKQCVASDAARKRAARKYTNRGLEPPPSLLRRETEEYDRRQALLCRGLSSGYSAAGSSFTGASSSRTALTPVKREPEELSRLRAVKREPEADAEDFLPPSEVNAMEPAILARSAWEEEEEARRRRPEDEINVVMYEQGLTRGHEFDEKEEEWRREANALEAMYIDLTSNEE